MEISIRRAILNDYDRLCHLLAECDALHAAALPGIFHAVPDPQAARTREYISGLLQDFNTLVLVAEQSGQIVGAIITIVRDTPPIPILTPRRLAFVDIIAIRHDQQGRGTGRELMKAAEQWARCVGAQEIELNVFTFNQKAIRFYESLEYTEISKKMVKQL
jgi:diamine N-acetyltransferase